MLRGGTASRGFHEAPRRVSNVGETTARCRGARRRPSDGVPAEPVARIPAHRARRGHRRRRRRQLPSPARRGRRSPRTGSTASPGGSRSPSRQDLGEIDSSPVTLGGDSSTRPYSNEGRRRSVDRRLRGGRRRALARLSEARAAPSAAPSGGAATAGRGSPPARPASTPSGRATRGRGTAHLRRLREPRRDERGQLGPAYVAAVSLGRSRERQPRPRRRVFYKSAPPEWVDGRPSRASSPTRSGPTDGSTSWGRATCAERRRFLPTTAKLRPPLVAARGPCSPLRGLNARTRSARGKAPARPARERRRPRVGGRRAHPRRRGVAGAPGLCQERRAPAPSFEFVRARHPPAVPGGGRRPQAARHGGVSRPGAAAPVPPVGPLPLRVGPGRPPALVRDPPAGAPPALGGLPEGTVAGPRAASSRRSLWRVSVQAGTPGRSSPAAASSLPTPRPYVPYRRLSSRAAPSPARSGQGGGARPWRAPLRIVATRPTCIEQTAVQELPVVRQKPI